MMKFVFVAIVMVWGLCGIIGGITAKNQSNVNVWMIVLFTLLPALPFIAHFCGLL